MSKGNNSNPFNADRGTEDQPVHVIMNQPKGFVLFSFCLCLLLCTLIPQGMQWFISRVSSEALISVVNTSLSAVDISFHAHCP